MTRAIYAGYQRYFLEMARVLERDAGWEPAYWMVVPAIDAEIAAAYPAAIRHDHFAAMKGIPAPGLEGMSLPALDADHLADFAYHEAILLRMLERNDSHTQSFRYRERVQLYYFLLRYWGAVLDQLRIDVVVFEDSPHQSSDYILYAMARRKGIQTVIFIPTSLKRGLPGAGMRMRFFPVRSFEDGSTRIRQAYRAALASPGDVRPKASSDLEKYIAGLSGHYDKARTLHLYDQEAEASEIAGAVSPIRVRVRDAMRGVRKLANPSLWSQRARLMMGRPEARFLSDQKQRGKSFRESKLSYPEHIYYKSRSILKKRRLWAHYERMAAKSVDLSVPYVFCALHYQPEKTTSPLGGYFVDQLLMVELLAQSLPAGWRLYVKDHVSQYVSSYTRYGEAFRSPEFFRQLAAIPGATILSLTHDTFELVDRSVAVATITGTTGWEAVVRGRPALVFGSAWYRGCEGVFVTRSAAEVAEAYRAIAEGYRVDPAKVELFGAVVEQNSFEGVIGGPGEQRYFDITDAENGASHAAAALSIVAPDRGAVGGAARSPHFP